MERKLFSFITTLALIAWNVVDITRGNHPVVSWILIGVLSFFGLFELIDLSEEKNKNKKPGNEAGNAEPSGQ